MIFVAIRRLLSGCVATRIATYVVALFEGKVHRSMLSRWALSGLITQWAVDKHLIWHSRESPLLPIFLLNSFIGKKTTGDHLPTVVLAPSPPSDDLFPVYKDLCPIEPRPPSTMEWFSNQNFNPDRCCVADSERHSDAMRSMVAVGRQIRDSGLISYRLSFVVCTSGIVNYVSSHYFHSHLRDWFSSVRRDEGQRRGKSSEDLNLDCHRLHYEHSLRFGNMTNRWRHIVLDHSDGWLLWRSWQKAPHSCIGAIGCCSILVQITTTHWMWLSCVVVLQRIYSNNELNNLFEDIEESNIRCF